MGIDRYHNRGIRGLLSVCVMSTTKMAETITDMEDYLQLVSLPATDDIFAQRSTPLRQNLRLTKKLNLNLKIT